MSTPIYDELVRATGTVPHPEDLDREQRSEAVTAAQLMLVRSGMAFLKSSMDVGALAARTGRVQITNVQGALIDARDQEPVPTITREQP